MKTRITALLAVIVCASIGSVVGGAQERSLEDVLGSMDGVSNEFRNMAADIERESVTAYINSRRFESGLMYFVRGAEASRIRVAITDPAPKDLLVDEGKLRIFNPLINRMEEFALGEHEDKVEFMVVGFGTSRDDLLRYYDVALGGEETLDGAVMAVLDLTPLDPDVARQFTTLRLWMDQERWVPVQTRVNQLSGDYLIIRFTNVRTNTEIPDSAFDLDLPDDVEIFRP